jgi:hypothetical protein
VESFRSYYAFNPETRSGGGLFGDMFRDSPGNLYSTTWPGGNNGYGAVVELTPLAPRAC